MERREIRVCRIEDGSNGDSVRIGVEVECVPIKVRFVWAERQVLKEGLRESEADGRPVVRDDPVGPATARFGS